MDELPHSDLNRGAFKRLVARITAEMNHLERPPVTAQVSSGCNAELHMAYLRLGSSQQIMLIYA